MNAPNTDVARAPEQEPPIKLPPHPPPSNRLLHRSGLALTAAWVCGWILYIVINREAVGGLAPNEAGDFLAGVFAPLAFLWLVLGFFQQGQELRHSAEALWLQGRELQNSVEQQRDLVNVTREQLAFESARMAAEREESDRAAQPVFQIKASGYGPADNQKRAYRFILSNHGRACTGVEVTTAGNPLTATSVMPAGHELTFSLLLEPSGTSQSRIQISYRDANLIPRETWFTISQTRNNFAFSLDI